MGQCRVTWEDTAEHRPGPHSQDTPTACKSSTFCSRRGPPLLSQTFTTESLFYTVSIQMLGDPSTETPGATVRTPQPALPAPLSEALCSWQGGQVSQAQVSARPPQGQQAWRMCTNVPVAARTTESGCPRAGPAAPPGRVKAELPGQLRPATECGRCMRAWPRLPPTGSPAGQDVAAPHHLRLVPRGLEPPPAPTSSPSTFHRCFPSKSCTPARGTPADGHT